VSVKALARVWEYSQRKDGELLVMLALADFSNDVGECWPSIPVLAAKARLTERQTRRILNTLEDAGEIRRTRSDGGRNRRNHYFITLNENPDIITGKELQGKNNTVIGDTKTLTPMSGAINRHRTVNRRVRSKATPLSDPAINEFKEFWAGEYRKRFEVEYHFEHAKDGAHAKALLVGRDLDALKMSAEKFFDADDEWIQTKGGFTIGVFRSQINKINSIRPKWRRNFEDEGMLDEAT
jgi:hypothetical protein